MVDDADFIRTQEDPVTFLRLRAMVLAPRLGVSIDVADRLISIVIAALGPQWLNEVANDVPDALPLPFPRQYLGHLISTAGERQIREILELGQYLEALYSVPGMTQAIQGLKSGYHQTLLQLAMSARFQLAGASVVSLEPPAEGGRLSDIHLQFEETEYQIECYRPTYKQENEETYEVVRCSQGVLEKARGASRPYAIAIQFTETPTPSLRREAIGVVGHAIRTLESASDVPIDQIPAILLERSGVVVSVVPTLLVPPGSPPILPRHPQFPRKDDNVATFMRVGTVAAKEAAGIYADPPMGVGASCVGIWIQKEQAVVREPGTAIEKLGRKIEGKIVQARSGAGHSRIIVVDAREADILKAAGQPTIDRLRGKLVLAHANVGAVLLTHRRWIDPELRYAYPLTALVCDKPSSLLQLLLQRLNAT